MKKERLVSIQNICLNMYGAVKKFVSRDNLILNTVLLFFALGAVKKIAPGHTGRTKKKLKTNLFEIVKRWAES